MSTSNLTKQCIRNEGKLIRCPRYNSILKKFTCPFEHEKLSRELESIIRESSMMKHDNNEQVSSHQKIELQLNDVPKISYLRKKFEN